MTNVSIQSGVLHAISALRAMAPIVSLRYLSSQRGSVLSQIYQAVRGIDSASGFGQEATILYWSFARGFEIVSPTSGGVYLRPVPPTDQNGRPHLLGLFAGGDLVQPEAALKRVMEVDIPAVFIFDGLTAFLDPKMGGAALSIQAQLDRAWTALKIREAKIPMRDEDGNLLNPHGRPVQPGESPAMHWQPSQSIRWLIVGGNNPVLPLDFNDRVRLYRFELPTPTETEALIRSVCQVAERTQGIPMQLSDDEIRQLTYKMNLFPEEEAATVLRIGLSRFKKSDGRLIQVADEERRRLLAPTNLKIMKPPKTAVGGMANLKAWVERSLKPSLIRAMDNPEDARKGLMLVGPPGTGKSLMAAQIAEQMGVLAISLNIGDMLSSGLGDSESNLSYCLELAEALSPCILFIDEVDKAGLDRDASSRSDGGVVKRLLGKLLTFMAEDHPRPIFFLFTANRADKLDTALTRGGRLDKVFLVDLPTQEERASILAIHLAQRRNSLKTADIQKAAKATDGFSGAELREVVRDAKDFALLRTGTDEAPIMLSDLQAAISEYIPLSIREPEEVRQMRVCSFASPAHQASQKCAKNLRNVDPGEPTII